VQNFGDQHSTVAPLLAYEQAIANSLAKKGSNITTLPFSKRDALQKHKEGLALLLTEIFGENVSVFQSMIRCRTSHITLSEIQRHNLSYSQQDEDSLHQ
jgi:hypothetical protein